MVATWFPSDPRAWQPSFEVLSLCMVPESFLAQRVKSSKPSV